MEWSKEKQTPQIDHSQTKGEQRGAANGDEKSSKAIRVQWFIPVVPCGSQLNYSIRSHAFQAKRSSEVPNLSFRLLVFKHKAFPSSASPYPPLHAVFCTISEPLCCQWPIMLTSAAIILTCLEKLAPFPDRFSFPPEALPKHHFLLPGPCWYLPVGDSQSQRIITSHLAISGHCCCLFPCSRASFYKGVFIYN